MHKCNDVPRERRVGELKPLRGWKKQVCRHKANAKSASVDARDRTCRHKALAMSLGRVLQCLPPSLTDT